MAVQHWKSTELRLLKMPEVEEQYCDVPQQHIEKGYVERNQDVDLFQAVWFCHLSLLLDLARIQLKFGLSLMQQPNVMAFH